MKLIEKTCPNCGGNLKFNKNDEKVVCEYCKKEFLIEEDKEHKDYHLELAGVDKAVVKGLFYSYFIIAFVIVLFVGSIIFGVKSCSVSKEITKLENISESTKKEIYKDSKSVLDTYAMMNIGFKQRTAFENLGFYLFINNNNNTLFDVYKGTFVHNGEEKEYYVAVKYEDIENGKMLHGNTVGSLGSYNTFSYGFESNVDLYNYLISKVEYQKVYASDKLYK